MTFKVPNEHRVITGPMGSDKSYGCNGLFMIPKGKINFRVIASDGAGWEHVSVSLNKKRSPTWDEMCFIKDMFWDKEDTVIQYHPSEENYVNHHPYCLHLWRPIDYKIPIPDSILIGPK